eukprot:512657_1
MCKLAIYYEYDDVDPIMELFEKKPAKQMLADTNLILQFIDQRKLEKSKTINIDMQIKYQHMYPDGDKSSVRIWRYELSDFLLKIGNDFNWKINADLKLSVNTLHVSSLWITNDCCVSCEKYSVTDRNEYFNMKDTFGVLAIICKKKLLIDKKCSISMTECGINGAIHDEQKGESVYEVNTKHNGHSGKRFGGGGGYKENGAVGRAKYTAWPNIDAFGGDQYLFDKTIKSNYDIATLSVGFGGGCATSIKGSQGGNGGGKILISCNKLVFQEGAKITCNGSNGLFNGGGGSGGLIFIITNKNINASTMSLKNKFEVYGGIGDDNGGNGSAGSIVCALSDKIGLSSLLDHKTHAKVIFDNKNELDRKTFEFLEKTKSSYLKSVLFSTISEQEAEIFQNLSIFIGSQWIGTCLEDIIKDKEFLERIELFLPKQYLKGMSVFKYQTNTTTIP